MDNSFTSSQDLNLTQADSIDLNCTQFNPDLREKELED